MVIVENGVSIINFDRFYNIYSKDLRRMKGSKLRKGRLINCKIVYLEEAWSVE